MNHCSKCFWLRSCEVQSKFMWLKEDYEMKLISSINVRNTSKYLLVFLHKTNSNFNFSSSFCSWSLSGCLWIISTFKSFCCSTKWNNYVKQPSTSSNQMFRVQRKRITHILVMYVWRILPSNKTCTGQRDWDHSHYRQV